MIRAEIIAKYRARGCNDDAIEEIIKDINGALSKSKVNELSKINDSLNEKISDVQSKLEEVAELLESS